MDVCPAIVDNLADMLLKDEVPYNVKAQISLALLDRAGLTPPKGNVTVNVNTLISDRARELLAQRTAESLPPLVQNINIIEERQEELT